MTNKQQSMTEALRRDRPLFGFLQSQPNATLTELAGLCGYDFVFVDCEHGMFQEPDVLEVMRALMLSGALTVVRVPDHEPKRIGRYLDMGVHAIIVPNVKTAEQATRLVEAFRYPPKGIRSCGASMHRSTRYGQYRADELQSPPVLIALIESVIGAQNSEAIARVEGVHGLMIGPYDLSCDAGSVADFRSEAFLRATQQIEQAAAANGCFLGGVPLPDTPIPTLIERGYRFAVLGSDAGLLRRAMSAQVEDAHRLVANRKGKEGQ